MINQTGQGFESFRLLIGVIIALIVGVTIFGIIGYFEELEVSIGYQKMTRGLNKAVNAVTDPANLDQYAFEEDVRLRKGTYVASIFSEEAFVPEECVFFDEVDNKRFKVRESGFIADVLHNVTIDMHFQCVAYNEPIEQCQLACQFLDTRDPNYCDPTNPDDISTFPIKCKIFLEPPTVS